MKRLINHLRTTYPPAGLSVTLALIIGFVLGAGGLVLALISTFTGSGHVRLIPLVSADDRIYSIFLANPHFCLQNITSTLAEGACRVQPLWFAAHSLYHFQSPAFATLCLRIILIGAIGGVLYWGIRIWSRQTSLNSSLVAFWLSALLVLAPFPLLFMGLGRELIDSLFVLNVMASPANLFSILMYLVCAGGLYVYRDNPKLWPVWGVLAGAWALMHPYFMLSWLSLAAVWTVIGRRLALKHPVRAALLFLPALTAGGYYFWLARGNEFFRYHLGANITGYQTSNGLALLAGASLAAFLLVLALKKDQIRWSKLKSIIDPYLASWLALAAAWQLLPLSYHRRMALFLLVPLALVLTRLAALPGARILRRGLGVMLVLNFALLFVTAYGYQWRYFEHDLRPITVTSTDLDTARYLKDNPTTIYIGSLEAVSRFPWLSHTRMLNVQSPESPDFHEFRRLLSDAGASAKSCPAIAGELRRHHVAALIFDKYSTASKLQAAYFNDCSLPVDYENADWVIFSLQYHP